MKGQVAGSTDFEALVRREDVTLEELLRSEEAVGAAKRGHPGLLALCGSDRLKGMRLSDLIGYLIDEPETDADYDRGRRFPFLAGEMVSNDVPEILDQFFSDQVLLDQLFSVLQRDQLNLVTAGYFSSAALSLLSRNPGELVLYMFGKYDYSLDLVRHLRSRGICDFLIRLLKCEQGGSQFAIDKMRLLEFVVESVDSRSANPAVLHAGLVLLEIIENGRDLKGWKVYMALLTQSECVRNLCEGLASPNETVIKVAAEVLTAVLSLEDLDGILNVNFAEISRVSRPKETGGEQEEGPSPQIYNVFELLQIFLEPVTSYLSLGCSLSTALEEKPALGPARIALVRLLSILIRNQTQKIEQSLLSCKTLSVLTVLFAENCWASLLHDAYESVVHSVIESPSAELKSDLLVNVNLPGLLAAIGQDPYITSDTKGKTRKGYMGHVTRIGNYLLGSVNQALVATHLTFNSDWIVFVNEVLQVRNDLEGKRLGQTKGENKRYESEDEAEDLGQGLSTPSQLYQELLNLRPSSLLSELEGLGKDRDDDVSDDAICLDDFDDGNLVNYDEEAAYKASEPDLRPFLQSQYWKLPVGVEANLPDLD